MDVTKFVKRLYAGCGLESEMLELMGLLNDLVDSYYSGELDEAGLTDIVIKICEAISAHMSSCGKTYAIDKCVDDVTNLVKSSAPRGGFRSLRSLLRKKVSKGKGVGLIP